MVGARRVMTNFGGVVVVPLQGAIVIVVCYGWGSEGDEQFWWSGRGAIAGCHCSVLWRCGKGDGGTAKFGGVVPLLPLLCAVVAGGGRRPTLGEWCHCWVPFQLRGGWRPTLGEWTWCHCWVPIRSRSNGIQTNWTALNFLQTLFSTVSTLITQKLVVAMWGLCWFF